MSTYVVLFTNPSLKTKMPKYTRTFVHYPFCNWEMANTNIARGTTDPEIDSETWTKLGNNMAPLALIANLATRWRHLTFSH